MVESIEQIITIMISIAYITLSERKIMGGMQRRVGPNKIGKEGIIQPIIDGIKLITKEIIIPIRVSTKEMLIGPITILILTLIIWIPIPLSLGVMIGEGKYSIIYILAISSINVYLYIYSGWSTQSKYGRLGTIRSIAQLISYEVSISIIIMSIISINKTYNINEIITSQIYIPNIIPLGPIGIIYYISILAETNRTPFDLPEAESELVAGYIIEYSSIGFGSIYLSEYGFILVNSYIYATILIGTIVPIITTVIIYGFIYIRALLPRLRYDQLMTLGWTRILPISITNLIIVISYTYIIP